MPGEAGTSITTTGVRPSTSCTSTLAPSGACSLHHARISSTAAARCPFAAQSASKAGDLAGIRMYCSSTGSAWTHWASTVLETTSASIMRSFKHAGLRQTGVAAPRRGDSPLIEQQAPTGSENIGGFCGDGCDNPRGRFVLRDHAGDGPCVGRSGVVALGMISVGVVGEKARKLIFVSGPAIEPRTRTECQPSALTIAARHRHGRSTWPRMRSDATMRPPGRRVASSNTGTSGSSAGPTLEHRPEGQPASAR